MKIRKAIIPVAGMGTRFLPATKAQPKEMLPVVDKPVIQYIVEEAVAAGIEEIIFVTALGKQAIENHFDRNFELEYRLEEKQKKAELELIQEIGKLAKFAFVRQAKPMGDGHALLSALPFVDAHEPVAVLFGDDIIYGEKPAIGELFETYYEYEQPVIAVQEVPEDQVHRYGVIDGPEVKKGVFEIQQFVEKPPVGEAPSNQAVIGRYVLSPEIYPLLQTATPGKDGEIRLADAFGAHLQNNGKLFGRQFSGKRYDCGNKLQFIIAQIELGLTHPEVKQELQAYLDSLR